MNRASLFRLMPVFVVVLSAAVIAPGTAAQAQSSGKAANPENLSESIGPLLSILSGNSETFAITAGIDVQIDDQIQHVDARLVRFDSESFDLQLTHSDYSLQIRRRANETAFALPHHKVVFTGAGKLVGDDQLAPEGMAARLIGSGSVVALYAPVILGGDPAVVSQVLTNLIETEFDSSQNRWQFDDDFSMQFSNQNQNIAIQVDGEHSAVVKIETNLPAMSDVNDWPGYQTVSLERKEIERTLARGVRRAMEILLPSRQLTNPPEQNKTVEHGELRWQEGQRVVLLHGTPEEVGFAHGQLLNKEAQRCIDSVLYTFGTVNTIRNGTWFRNDLDQAYQRLAPFIPEDHQAETLAFAKAMELDPETAQAINVFPELFHCSGFALFGNATIDGKLLHGRVLDYMTTIGLQDSATTFIVSIDGKHGFANVGYAGFIGSVSGMNDQSISLGEMGGHGEGQWDGVPMATLMRRALEECSTLQEVQQLWETNPRTCEYYYVFADGKTNEAVGVMATPDLLKFVQPGETHELLGEGIEDAVVLSAGGRLETLRQRVQEKYGKVDVDVAKWLMSRPVAMSSNLHNVLFVPQDLIFYVANASHSEPAANRPYVKMDLEALLKSMPSPTLSP